MNGGKAMTKTTSKRASIHAIWEKQQELLRELRDILDAYGPPWYKEELATRLNKIIVMPIQRTRSFISIRPLRKLR
jgi:hypothetical protein